jgi:cytochrome c peroxidase
MNTTLKKLTIVAVLVTLTLTILLAGAGFAQPALTPEQTLGEFLYFDENLSEPAGQACASCHLPEAGFVDPDKGKPVSEGVNLGRFGDRNSPASAYAMYAPVFHEEIEDGDTLFIGGQFWDGRATGDLLGDPLADQALGPFLNPVEMANPNKAAVVWDARDNLEYGALFLELCMEGDSGYDVELAYNCVAESIAAFERTELFGQFNSKYDHYLQACLAAMVDPDDCAQGKGAAIAIAEKFFTKKEWAGFQLFMNDVNNNDGILDPGEGAACILCHVVDWTDPALLANEVVVPGWAPEGKIPPLFTDFTYDNLGVPKNWDNPFLYQDPLFNPLGAEYVDIGLGTRVPETDGLFKVMTLRNIHLTAPYGHNGFFKKLEDITDFYNTRDVLGMWPPPEVSDNVNTEELGNLGLSEKQVDALVKFMKTLSDGWMP